VRLTASRNRTRTALKRRRIDGRGQSIVEFALAVPIFLALLIGTLEAGLAYKARGAYQEATLEAVRVAAAAGQASDADQLALDELQRTLVGENLSNITSVVIYKANPNGVDGFAKPPIDTCPPPGPCYQPYFDNLHTNYVYKNGAFVYANSGQAPTSPDTCPSEVAGDPTSLCGYPDQSYWDPKSRKITVPTLDTIGIRVTYTFRSVTPLLPPFTMTQVAAVTIEPTSY